MTNIKEVLILAKKLNIDLRTADDGVLETLSQLVAPSPIKEVPSTQSKKNEYEVHPYKTDDGLFGIRALVNGEYRFFSAKSKDRGDFQASDLANAIKQIMEKALSSETEEISHSFLRGRLYKKPFARVHLSFDSRGSINSVKSKSGEWTLILNPENCKAPVIVSALNNVIQVFQYKMKKDDPAILKDPVLSTWRYDPKTFNPLTNGDINMASIRGRIGELAFHLQYPFIDWKNQYANLSGMDDFISSNGKTIDLKTINTPRNGLAIPSAQVSGIKGMADVFGLLLVEVIKDEIIVSCLGYMTKDGIKKYAITYPTQYLHDLDKWKVKQEHLEFKVYI